MNRIFLDTNIILDFLDDRRPGYYNAVKLIESLSLRNVEIYISEDMLSTVFYIHNNNKQTLEFFQFVLGKWKVAGFGPELMEEAVDMSLKYSLDLEDLLQCLCARKYSCSALVTNDKKFYDCGIKIYTSGEFINASR